MAAMHDIAYRGAQLGFSAAAHVLRWRRATPVAGQGAIRHIPRLLRLQKCAKPLLVTGPNLMKRGLPGEILGLLDAAGMPCAVFSDVEADPGAGTVEAIVDVYTREHCGGLIALGGGSPIDAAKAAAACIVRPDRTPEELGGLLKVGRPIPPFIAVPTTSGSGSETTMAAVITGRGEHKAAIMDPCLIPRYAVLDPLLVKSLPPAPTAQTGMDALTHAVEGYLCRTGNTGETRSFEKSAVKLIFENLEAAYQNGGDMAARTAMQKAAYRAGYAFTRAGVGNVHAIAHTLGGLYRVPHGLACAVVLPVVLQDYGPAAHQKLAALARMVGLCGQSDAALAAAFIGAVRGMNSRMGIPVGFSCIREEDMPKMVAWALEEANPLYPVPVIYDAARCMAVIRRLRLQD